MNRLSNIIESLLLVAGNAIEVSEIAAKLQFGKDEIEAAVDELKEKYSGDSGIHLISFSGKLQLSSNPSYSEEVSAILNPIKSRDLSQSMLEVLSIIAYKQPITRLEIEDIRGVNCDYALSMLAKHNLIRIAGRKDAVGKPILFGTSDEFLKRFQLSSLNDLPDYDLLLSRINIISEKDLYNSNRTTPQIEETDDIEQE